MTAVKQNEQITLSDSGELIVSLSIGYTCKFKISHWNDGLQFYIREDGKWIAEEIKTGQLIELSCENNNEIYEQFLEGIPAVVRKSVSPFLYNQFPLLYIIAQHKSLVDVLVNSPNLCWLTVCSAEQRNWSFEYVAEILKLKPIQIVEKLFHKNSEPLLSLIQRIVFEKGNRGEFEMLLRQIESPHFIHYFKEWEGVPIKALHIVNKRPIFLQTKLLKNELDLSKGWLRNRLLFTELQTLINSITRLHGLMGSELTEHAWLQIENYEALKSLNNKCLTLYNNSPQGIAAAQETLEKQKREVEQKEIYLNNKQNNMAFPLCPLGDFEGLIQIKTPNELGCIIAELRIGYSDFQYISLYSGSSFVYTMSATPGHIVELKKIDSKIMLWMIYQAKYKQVNNELYEQVESLISQ